MGAAPHAVHTRFPHPQTLCCFPFRLGCKRGAFWCNRGQTANDLSTQGDPASPVAKTSRRFDRRFVEELHLQTGLPACFAVLTALAHSYVGVGGVQERRHPLVRAKLRRDGGVLGRHRKPSAQHPSPILGLQTEPKETVSKAPPFCSGLVLRARYCVLSCTLCIES